MRTRSTRSVMSGSEVSSRTQFCLRKTRHPYRMEPGWFYSVDCTRVVSSHADIQQPDIAWWLVIEAGSADRSTSRGAPSPHGILGGRMPAQSHVAAGHSGARLSMSRRACDAVDLCAPCSSGRDGNSVGIALARCFPIAFEKLHLSNGCAHPVVGTQSVPTSVAT